MPTLVHGVDISTLEGWMIKINSNPSMFGKSLSRRWFRVSFVPASNDQKLIISYSTNKTSKEPRGWLYIEDVSGVYCRRDMIEVVSPARTLRFKGETTVEHRLWSESLHKLCNAPKPESAKAIEEEKRLVAESSALHERQRERLREQDRDRIADPKKTREYVDSSRERAPLQQAEEAKAAARKSMVVESNSRREPPPRRRGSSPEYRQPQRREEDRRSPRERHDDERNNRSDEDDDDGRRHDSAESDEEEEEAPPRRRQSVEPTRETAVPASADQRRQSANDRVRPQQEMARVAPMARGSTIGREPARRSPRDEDEDDSRRRRRVQSDSDEDDGDDDEPPQDKRSHPSTSQERRPSLLVASIKSLSPVIMAAAEPKAKVNANKPNEANGTATPIEARQPSPVRQDAKHSEDESESEDDDERPQKSTPRDDSQWSKQPPAHAQPNLQPQPSVAQAPQRGALKPKPSEYFDDNDDTGDVEEEEANNRRRASASAPVKAATAAPVSEVRADNNFAEDDWDAEDETPAPASKHTAASPQKRASAGFGGVAADSNFATEDWD